MDYEKKYKEALERARKLQENSNGMILKKWLWNIFPELSESEDEKIRKDILCYFEHYAHDIKGADLQKWVAWLEKQGEQKSTEHNENEEPQVYETNDGDVITYSETNGYKVIKPKFKVGDWVVFDNGNVEHITSIGTHGYTFDDGDYLLHDECDKIAHLWTIQDAKDGDVIVGNYGTFIFMGENNGYCGVLSNNTFIRGTGNNEWTECLHPATKGQRDLLFQKMKEAGYTFDLEKKVLKKVGNEIEIPFGAKDSELQEATYYIPKGFYAVIDDDKVVIKKGEKPAAWSKKDEKMFEYALNMIEWYSGKNKDKSRFVSDWLKSIKQRIGE